MNDRNDINEASRPVDREECACEGHPHCSHLSPTPLPEDILRKVSGFFRILGDPTRVRIVFALSRGEMCVCDLAEHLGMTKSAVSHQLATLKEAHFVLCHREGKHIRYRLADDHVAHILSDGLAHICEPEEEETK